MEKHFETLELPAVLNRLAEYASFSAGKELALALRPAFDLAEVQHLQQETGEARLLLDTDLDFSLGGVHDVRTFVENSLRGFRLLPQDLLDIRDTLHRAQILGRALTRHKETYPSLAAIAYQLSACPELIKEIDRCISEHGEVLDRASPRLGRLRSELQIAYDRLTDKLNRMLANPQYAKYMQEAYITQRDGRYVIPIKANYKGRISGLVHDQSASGATLFIEPLATVDLNNKWRELQLAEEREIERILLMLSGLVATEADTIKYTVEAFAKLDLILMRAKYANTIHATSPDIVPFAPRKDKKDKRARVIHPGSRLDLIQARHPLIDPAVVVPVDIHLKDYYIIVITGPNTGGKTVSLKTAGLLALMAQCGMHLPAADGSCLTVFEHICADIGDEQSIEQSLSTFSSHMSNIIKILQTINERSLVLLDELGAGTDPVEGAALARSLLTHLLQRRATTMATTHYSDIKMFAHDTPSVTNACVEFDIETLAPTYHLTIGLPGHSNAFAIANRLGLPNAIVRRAQGLLSSSHLEAERFLAQIKETKEQIDQDQQLTQVAHSEAKETAQDLRTRLDNIEQERSQILNQAREQAAEELAVVRKELRQVQHKLAMMTNKSSRTNEIKAKLDALNDQIAPIQPLLTQLADLAEQESEPEIAVGDTVWVADLNATGEVLVLDGESAEVQVGAFRVSTRRSSLKLHLKAAATQAVEEEDSIKIPVAPVISLELDLRGWRVEPAMRRIEKYLDDAYRSQAPYISIIHGKGTGRLRKAVLNLLQHHPLVGSFRRGAEGEGDTGVTIVKFN